MLRNDFVSNSSSSSFIVAAEDNKYDILLQHYDVLTLSEYVEHYIREDVFCWYSIKSINDIKFVSDSVFNKEFSRGITNTFPNSCKELVESYITLNNNRPEGTWDSDNIRKWGENLDAIFNNIKEKIIKSLELKWKDVKFHFAEISDDSLWYDKDGNEKERDDNVDTMEELVQERMDYMNSLKPLKFFRTFCHH